MAAKIIPFRLKTSPQARLSEVVRLFDDAIRLRQLERAAKDSRREPTPFVRTQVSPPHAQ